MFVLQRSYEKQTIQEFLISSDLSKYVKLVKTFENGYFFYAKFIFVTFLVLQSFAREQKCSSIPLWELSGG